MTVYNCRHNCSYVHLELYCKYNNSNQLPSGFASSYTVYHKSFKAENLCGFHAFLYAHETDFILPWLLILLIWCNFVYKLTCRVTDSKWL